MISGNGILNTNLFHIRYHPIIHKFAYKLFYLKINLNSVENINTQYKWLKHNQKSLYSIFDQDFLSLYSGSLSEKINK